MVSQAECVGVQPRLAAAVDRRIRERAQPCRGAHDHDGGVLCPAEGREQALRELDWSEEVGVEHRLRRVEIDPFGERFELHDRGVADQHVDAMPIALCISQCSIDIKN